LSPRSTGGAPPEGKAAVSAELGPVFKADRRVAPFATNGVESCSVEPGTKIFVAAASLECSTFEANSTPQEELTEDQLRDCAPKGGAQVAPTVTVDGKSVPVTEVQTPMLLAGPGAAKTAGWGAGQ
jgi:hypothetical protein